MVRDSCDYPSNIDVLLQGLDAKTSNVLTLHRDNQPLLTVRTGSEGTCLDSQGGSVVHLSRYNHLISIPEGTYVFNALNGSLVEFNELEYEKLRSILKAGGPFGLLSDEDWSDLVAAGIITDTDDFDTVAERFREACRKPVVSFVLVPTLECNLDCPYCYEKPVNRSRAPEGLMESIADEIAKFIGRKREKELIVSIGWYGGEPLLESERVLRISRFLRSVSESYGHSFRGSIVTNGVLLSPSICDALISSGVTSAQVTIDGPHDIHNIRRPLRAGSGDSYSTIIRNIASACERGMHVSLRVNLDRTVASHLALLLADLADKGFSRLPKFRLYFAPVRSAKGVCANSEACYTTKEFASVETQGILMAKEFGISVESYPSARPLPCSALLPDFYIVGPTARVHKCLSLVGQDEFSIGTFGADGLQVDKPDMFALWSSYDPLQLQCSECSFFPICVGGCPLARLSAHSELEGALSLMDESDSCTTWRYNLKDIIQAYVRESLPTRGL